LPIRLCSSLTSSEWPVDFELAGHRDIHIMNEYRRTIRTTRTCTLDELRPELAEAIRAHAQRQKWTNFEADVLACCETTTERLSVNLFDAWLNGSAPLTKYLALIATPQRLIWASSADNSTTASAASALYKEMRLKIFTPKFSTGIAFDIYARMDGTREKVGGRLRLDAGPEARQFCEAVHRATNLLVEPVEKKPRRKWFGRW
jgi:hypothetical protein